MRFVGVCITLALSATAYADAKQLVAEAEALIASGDLLGAAAKFRAAYKEEPVPEHICNSGVAYHRAQDLPRSHRYLNQCVTMGSSLDPTYRENLRKVVDSVEAKLVAGDFTPIDLSLDPATAIATFDGGKPFDDEIVGGGRIWVPYGAYKLVARADGYIDKPVDVTANSDAAMPLRVTLEKKAVVVPPEPPPVQPTRWLVDAPQPSKVPGFVLSGATVALAITGIVFYVKADNLTKKAESPENDRARYDELHADAHTKQRYAWLFGGLAGATAIAAGVVWWRIIRAPKRIEVSATTSGVAVRGRF